MKAYGLCKGISPPNIALHGTVPLVYGTVSLFWGLESPIESTAMILFEAEQSAHSALDLRYSL